MNLNISGHHVEVSNAMREYVEAKLERVTRHFDGIVDIDVTLSVGNESEKLQRHKAEVKVRVRGKEMFAEQNGEDMYSAIDQLMDKMDRQVCRHKEQGSDHQKGSAKRMQTYAE